MRDFSVTIPGDAPALNRTYKIVRLRNPKGEPVTRLAKTSEVSAWQERAAYIIRLARPKGWAPERRVRITMECYTSRARDCDSAVKATLDAVAFGLGIDDKCFLVTVQSNEVDKANPRMVIEVTNE